MHALQEPVEVSWPALRQQFGENYKELCYFRRDVVPSIKLTLAVYPDARVTVDDRNGLILYPAAPLVPERKKLAG
jgi:hypothetical protein